MFHSRESPECVRPSCPVLKKEKHPRRFKVQKFQSVQDLLCQTLAFIFLDLGRIKIISQGQFGT